MKPTLFGTKYPIVCAPMFQVSDIKLALAVANEGCLPTFHSRDLTQILEYKSITNSNKFGIFVELIGHPRETYILDFLKHINPQIQILRSSPVI